LIGSYRYRLRRQIAQKAGSGAVIYVDDALLWGSIVDQSSHQATLGAAIIQTDVIIKLHNMTTALTPADRLVDTGTGDVYAIMGITRDFANNELVVTANRKILGKVL